MTQFQHGPIKAHPYQRQALVSTIRGWRRKMPTFPGDDRTTNQIVKDWASVANRDQGYRSQLIVKPTGTGKTITFGFLSRYAIKRGWRVLVLAHRDELIEQAVEKLAFLGIPTVIEKANQRARDWLALEPDRRRVVVGSVQTLQKARLASWSPDAFDLIVVDEAHHALSDNSYGKILKHFASARVVGVTATDRSDGNNLGSIFERKSFQMTLADAIGDGWLVRVDGVSADVQVDLRGIRTTGGDFNQADLDERISLAIEPLAKGTQQEIGDRITIVFTPCVKSAYAFRDALIQLGVKACATDGSDPKRKETVKAFKAGEYQVMCNCAILTEGFDYPPVSAIVIARPTKSTTLLAQMVGRGTRTCTSIGKTDCLVVDFGWVLKDSKIKSVVDLVVPKHANPADVEQAKQLLKDNLEHDPQAALERARLAREAKENAEAKRQADRLKIKVKDREVKYQRHTFDPVGMRHLMGLRPVAQTHGTVGMPVNPETAAKLKDLGFDTTEGVSQREAIQEIRAAEDRKLAGMASTKQMVYLIRRGYSPDAVRQMTEREAGRAIGQLSGHQRSG